MYDSMYRRGEGKQLHTTVCTGVGRGNDCTRYLLIRHRVNVGVLAANKQTNTILNTSRQIGNRQNGSGRQKNANSLTWNRQHGSGRQTGNSLKGNRQNGATQRNSWLAQFLQSPPRTSVKPIHISSFLNSPDFPLDKSVSWILVDPLPLTVSELRSCVKVEVAVLGSPFLTATLAAG